VAESVLVGLEERLRLTPAPGKVDLEDKKDKHLVAQVGRRILMAAKRAH